MSHMGGECPCQEKNKLTCITFNTNTSTNATLVGTVNTDGSFYKFPFPNTFSLQRNRPCTVKICSASIAFYKNNYAIQAESIDAVTNIAAQGLNFGSEFNPDFQSVRCAIDIGDGQETTSSGGAELRTFQCNQPSSTKFRCQSLPDEFFLSVQRSENGGISNVAPNQMSMTLQIEFD